MVRMGFYGTLKKGGSNHTRFSIDRGEFVGTMMVPGYKLTQPKWLDCPLAVKDDASNLFLEVYDVPITYADDVKAMEFMAGYDLEVYNGVYFFVDNHQSNACLEDSKFFDTML